MGGKSQNWFSAHRFFGLLSWYKRRHFREEDIEPFKSLSQQLFNMFAKFFAAALLCAMIIGSHQQVVVPAYSAAYVPSAYAYPSVYSPYVAAAAYPSVWAWGSNKNKEDAPRAFARPTTLLNNEQKSA